MWKRCRYTRGEGRQAGKKEGRKRELRDSRPGRCLEATAAPGGPREKRHEFAGDNGIHQEF